jgi:hypothetical protein
MDGLIVASVAENPVRVVPQPFVEKKPFKASPAADLPPQGSAAEISAAAAPSILAAANHATSADGDLGSLVKPTAPSPMVERAPAAEPVKVMALQIDLPDHGSINVRMALSGRAISLRIRSDRERTTTLLRQDRDKLADALRVAGYETRVQNIDVAHVDSSIVATPAGQDQANSGEGTASGQSRGGGGDRGSDPSQHAPNDDNTSPATSKQHAIAHDNTTGDRGSRALYV